MLRTYPPRFGIQLLKIRRQLIDTRVPPPVVPDDVAAKDLQEFFRDMPWDDLHEDSNLRDVLFYLRGNTSLNLGSWRPLFPTFM